jgi:hypothetical protein
MSKREKIASLMLIASLAMSLLIVTFTYGHDPLVVPSEDASFILGVFILPAVLAFLLVVFFKRLDWIKFEKR